MPNSTGWQKKSRLRWDELLRVSAMGFSSILVAALLAGSTPASESCRSIPGWENIVSGKKIRWIVVGEIHGTNEMPEIFADAVCLTSENKPVNVALEMPTIDQSRIDAYLSSDGGTEAKLKFLQANIWNGRFKDGRSSEAMFRLFDRLRNLHRIGRIRAVFAFQPMHFKKPPSETEYERAMADIIKANTPKAVRTLILVGNVHAMRTKVNFGPDPYFAMAGHLPKGKTLSLDIVNDGGLAWACGGPGQCGPMAVGRKNGVTSAAWQWRLSQMRHMMDNYSLVQRPQHRLHKPAFYRSKKGINRCCSRIAVRTLAGASV